MAALLDPDQLACLDATEPNYVRRRVSATSVLLTLDGGEQPEGFCVYESRWGVLAAPGAPPLELRSQRDLFALLRSRLPGFAELVGAQDLEATMNRLAENPALRGEARALFEAAGWSAPVTLDGDCATDGQTVRR